MYEDNGGSPPSRGRGRGRGQGPVTGQGRGRGRGGRGRGRGLGGQDNKKQAKKEGNPVAGNAGEKDAKPQVEEAKGPVTGRGRGAGRGRGGRGAGSSRGGYHNNNKPAKREENTVAENTGEKGAKPKVEEAKVELMRSADQHSKLHWEKDFVLYQAFVQPDNLSLICMKKIMIDIDDQMISSLPGEIVEKLLRLASIGKFGLSRMRGLLEDIDGLFQLEVDMRYMQYINRFQDTLLNQFMLQCSMLTSLNLSRCRALTSPKICEVLKKVKALTSLDLSDADCRDDVMKAIRQNLPRLVNLNIRYNLRITDKGAYDLCYDCEGIAVTGAPLERLIMTETNIRCTGIRHILTTFQELRYMKHERLQQTLARIHRSFPTPKKIHLQKLEFDNMIWMQDRDKASIIALADMCACLKDLEICLPDKYMNEIKWLDQLDTLVIRRICLFEYDTIFLNEGKSRSRKAQWRLNSCCNSSTMQDALAVLYRNIGSNLTNLTLTGYPVNISLLAEQCVNLVKLTITGGNKDGIQASDEDEDEVYHPDDHPDEMAGKGLWRERHDEESLDFPQPCRARCVLTSNTSDGPQPTLKKLTYLKIVDYVIDLSVIAIHCPNLEELDIDHKESIGLLYDPLVNQQDVLESKTMTTFLTKLTKLRVGFHRPVGYIGYRKSAALASLLVEARNLESLGLYGVIPDPSKMTSGPRQQPRLPKLACKPTRHAVLTKLKDFKLLGMDRYITDNVFGDENAKSLAASQGLPALHFLLDHALDVESVYIGIKSLTDYDISSLLSQNSFSKALIIKIIECDFVTNASIPLLLPPGTSRSLQFVSCRRMNKALVRSAAVRNRWLLCLP